MSEHMEHVDDHSFEHTVLGSTEPYLLDFSAVWCPPCRALEPILESLAQEHRGKLRVGGAPTLVLFRDGKEVARRLGLTSKRNLSQLLGL